MIQALGRNAGDRFATWKRFTSVSKKVGYANASCPILSNGKHETRSRSHVLVETHLSQLSYSQFPTFPRAIGRKEFTTDRRHAHLTLYSKPPLLEVPYLFSSNEKKKDQVAPEESRKRGILRRGLFVC